MNITTSFNIEYPVGLDTQRIKGHMFLFTKMMLNGFAKYELVVKVYLTWDKVYVFVDDHVKEYGLYGSGSEAELIYLTSHKKDSFLTVLESSS
ncbi:hypothetical protein BS614_30935 (plasmid) [Paenibacillus xylanexedens]|uniref:hypothetical protein n=1 Tax=Paenibacillus xylanexedens TaxID=528191 RepID=UPI0009383726|nr:hypothetical protein [Paenibacillus xylanexedens]APO48537.1 hypothetical protein BS614_30935 [Paenibacillus xylanexedens]